MKEKNTYQYRPVPKSPTLKIGDRFRAKDMSCDFTITRLTRVGVDGDLICSDGRVVEGSATYMQLELDFIPLVTP